MASKKKVKKRKDSKIDKLKRAYKAGRLKFDSKKIAEAILKEFRAGFIK